MSDTRAVELGKQVLAAYQHLYDLVWLRTSALVSRIEDDSGSRSPKEQAWRLHHLLLAAIEDLAPEAHLPAGSREWRRYQLMNLRFVDALDVDAVAAELGISRREYFREQRRAIDSVTMLLRERLQVPRRRHPEPGDGEAHALLEQEAERASGPRRTADLPSVLQDAVSLLREVSIERGVQIAIPDLVDGALVDVEPNLLRQLVMATLGYMVERAQDAEIRVEVSREADAHFISLVAPLVAYRDLTTEEIADRRKLCEELAQLTGCDVSITVDAQQALGIQVKVSAKARPLVLVIDDNLDVLELIKRYLGRDYAVATAQSATEAWEMAGNLDPSIITLDLMMPEQDGWDLLQRLANSPELCHIPVVVCSILKQKSLALAMGASAFVEKPVTQQAILSVLNHLAPPRV